MENNQCGLWKTLRQRLGKQPQTEEVRYAVEFERTLRNLEARLHESDNADDIISRTLSTACDFYNANWAGFLEIDMDLGVWAPYVWFNTNPHDRTKELVRDFEEIAIMQRWLAAMENNDALIIPDVSSIKHEEPREYAVYQKLSIQSFIAVPVKPRPLGFLVVRNPRKNTTESSLLKMQELEEQTAAMQSAAREPDANGQSILEKYREYAQLQELTADIAKELVRNVVVYPGGRLDINLNYRDELEAMLKEAEAPIDAP